MYEERNKYGETNNLYSSFRALLASARRRFSIEKNRRSRFLLPKTGLFTVSLLLALALPYCAAAKDKGPMGPPDAPDAPDAPVGTRDDSALLSAGQDHTCVVIDGGVKCWGNGSNGQLGDGGSGFRHYAPVPRDVMGLEPGTGAGIIAVSLGGETSAVIHSAPIPAPSHTCALLENGGLKCWGPGGSGQLGHGEDGEDADRNTPVDVHTSESDPSPLRGITAFNAGYQHTCAVVRGGVKCWGFGGHGRLGHGRGTDSKNTPTDVAGLGPGSGVTAVSAGQLHTCAVVRGGVKCWGNGDEGPLGDEDSSIHNALVPGEYVIGLGADSGVIAVSAAGGLYTCALLSNGGVKCWGYGGTGELGDGTGTSSLIPVDVIAGMGDSSSLSNVIAISAGRLHTCALLFYGGAKCWGSNAAVGQLGNGDVVGIQSSPVDVVGLGAGSGVTAVSAGSDHTCALLSNGGVKCWGLGSHGRLGNNPAVSPEDPDWCRSPPCRYQPHAPPFPLPVNVEF